MTRWGIVLLVVCVGCGDDSAMPDGLHLVDAAIDAATPDAPPDAPGAACPNPATDAGGGGMYTLYINAEGVTLLKGNCDNARTNCTTLIVANQAVVPPFKQNDPNRQAFIDEIVQLVQSALLPYSVDVVTTRPASGDYNMIVLGGDCTLTGGTMPCQSFGVGVLPCSLANRDHISLDFDNTTVFPQGTPYLYANLILSDVGLFAAMSVSTTMGDCENRSGGLANDALCTFDRSATVSSMGMCSGAGTTEDEQDLLKTAFGCR